MNIKKVYLIISIFIFNQTQSASLEQENIKLSKELEKVKDENEKLKNNLIFYEETYNNPYANYCFDKNGKYINSIYIRKFTNAACSNIIKTNIFNCGKKKQIYIEVRIDEESSSDEYVNDCYDMNLSLNYFFDQKGHFKKHNDKITIGSKEYILVDEYNSLLKWYRKYHDSTSCTIL